MPQLYLDSRHQADDTPQQHLGSSLERGRPKRGLAALRDLTDQASTRAEDMAAPSLESLALDNPSRR